MLTLEYNGTEDLGSCCSADPASPGFAALRFRSCGLVSSKAADLHKTPVCATGIFDVPFLKDTRPQAGGFELWKEHD